MFTVRYTESKDTSWMSVYSSLTVTRLLGGSGHLSVIRDMQTAETLHERQFILNSQRLLPFNLVLRFCFLLPSTTERRGSVHVYCSEARIKSRVLHGTISSCTQSRNNTGKRVTSAHVCLPRDIL